MRRSVVVLAVAVAGGATYARLKAKQAVAIPDHSPAEWPPLEPAPRADSQPAGAAPLAAGEAAPIDGACPDGYPVKAKTSSSIYHTPGGRNYDRTIPDRCFATSADAEAAGFRAPKA